MKIDIDSILTEMVSDNPIPRHSLDDYININADSDFVREAMRRSAIKAIDTILRDICPIGRDKIMIQNFRHQMENES